MSEHQHSYVFLRQETRPLAQNGDRVLKRVVEDVYFCESCLDYRRVKVRTEVPDRQSFGWVEVWE